MTDKIPQSTGWRSGEFDSHMSGSMTSGVVHRSSSFLSQHEGQALFHFHKVAPERYLGEVDMFSCMCKISCLLTAVQKL